MTKKQDRNYAYPPALMDRDQAAYYLSIGTSQFDELVAEGKIPKTTIRYGGHPKYKRSDLDAYIESLEYVGNMPAL